eukprot:7843487-Pyramimonas_sp.AAC.1
MWGPCWGSQRAPTGRLRLRRPMGSKRPRVGPRWTFPSRLRSFPNASRASRGVRRGRAEGLESVQGPTIQSLRVVRRRPQSRQNIRNPDGRADPIGS